MMIFACESEQFSNALSMICAVLPKKATIAAFTQALLSAKDGKISLSGTDTESMIRVDLSGFVTPMGDFEFLLSAHDLLDYVKLLEGVIKFELINGFFRVSMKGSSQSFPIFPASDFPDSHIWKIRTECEELPAGSLLQAIESASRFVSKDANQGADFSGVYLEADGQELLITGLDRTSILCVRSNFEDGIGKIRNTMLCPDSIKSLVKMKFDHTDLISLKFPAEHLHAELLVFEQGPIWVAYRTIEAKTSYARELIRTQEFLGEVEFDVLEMGRSLARLATCNKGEENKRLSCSVFFKPDDTQLEMQTSSFVSKKTAFDSCKIGALTPEIGLPSFCVDLKRFQDLVSVSVGEMAVLRFPARNLVSIVSHKLGEGFGSIYSAVVGTMKEGLDK